MLLVWFNSVRLGKAGTTYHSFVSISGLLLEKNTFDFLRIVCKDIVLLFGLFFLCFCQSLNYKCLRIIHLCIISPITNLCGIAAAPFCFVFLFFQPSFFFSAQWPWIREKICTRRFRRVSSSLRGECCRRKRSLTDENSFWVSVARDVSPALKWIPKLKNLALKYYKVCKYQQNGKDFKQFKSDVQKLMEKVLMRVESVTPARKLLVIIQKKTFMLQMMLMPCMTI